MSTKVASIRINGNASGLVSSVKSAESEVKGSAQRMGTALKSALSTGMKGGADSLKSAFSTIKSTIGTLGGLAGGIGVVELARGAIVAEGGYRKLAFQITKAGGAATSFRQLQEQSHASALKWGQANEELGAAMSDVFRETGDAEFAQQALEKIAIAATGAHEPVATMGSIAGTLNEKFKITGEQLGDAMATVVGLADKGGVGLDELAGRLGIIGAVAKTAGLEGKEGFAEMVGMLNLADDGGKNLRKNITGLQGIFEQLGTKAGRVKAFAAVGLSPSKASGNVAKDVGQIVKATGGSRDKLEKAGFGAEQVAFLSEMGKRAEATGQDFETALREAGTSTLTFADLQAEAVREMATAEKKAAQALEKLKQTFSKPEITEAITKLMEQLPALAGLIEKIVTFAVENPATAGAMVGGAIAAKGAGEAVISGAITAAFARGGVSAAASLSGAFASGSAGLLAALGPLALVAAAAAAAYLAIKAIQDADAEREKEKADAENRGERFVEGGGETTQGQGAESTTAFSYRDPETGQMVTKTAADYEDPQEFDADREAQLEKNRQGVAYQREREAAEGEGGIAAAQAFLAPEPAAAAPARPAAGPKDGGIDARLLADMLGSKKLRVEVTNPEAIRGGVGGVPGMPAPGAAPRR